MKHLVSKWREQADKFAHYGAFEVATAMTRCAYELEDEISSTSEETLTLQEAADLSGFSYSTLQRKVSSGEIPNAGTKGSPLIKRKHLPRKAGPLN